MIMILSIMEFLTGRRGSLTGSGVMFPVSSKEWLPYSSASSATRWFSP